MTEPLDPHLSDNACPTAEELKFKEEACKPFVDYTINMLKNSISTIEEITISESGLPSIEVFSAIMNEVGKLFASNPDIEVFYEKPEDKDKKSPTYGMVTAKIVIRNLKLISAKKELGKVNSDLISENQKLSKSIKALSAKISQKSE